MSKLNTAGVDVPKIRESRSYCEGRAAAAAGALISTNPHPDGEDKDAWDDGFNSHTATPYGYPATDCCADAPGANNDPLTADSAAIDGATLVVTFSENVAGGSAAEGLTLLIEGEPADLTFASLLNDTITYTADPAAVNGDAVELLVYAGNDITADATGEPVQPADLTVTNNTA